ncbi:Uncharacterised protein [Delftia tsuruhatensis]|uniref:hypothetical protein n=1 Tax=Delftia tsuruhatensis TaxID=180282 RepID=UPI001E7BD09B|nr:hypothetical protein [Delftia tsuruhatensis]CAB5670265.1 Uncharacterised protein [Delftia tsuruhatensis]CAC9682978.1 Uncharacterised protein [Delftia tsuruhatensis]
MASRQNYPSLLKPLSAIAENIEPFEINLPQILDSLNWPVASHGLLLEQTPQADFQQQLLACIEAVSLYSGESRTLVFQYQSGALRLDRIDPQRLLHLPIERYEMLLFDSGIDHGERWLHLFYPMTRAHQFIEPMV